MPQVSDLRISFTADGQWIESQRPRVPPTSQHNLRTSRSSLAEALSASPVQVVQRQYVSRQLFPRLQNMELTTLCQTAAGVFSLLNDFSVSQGKAPLGFLNLLVYASTSASAFKLQRQQLQVKPSLLRAREPAPGMNGCVSFFLRGFTPPSSHAGLSHTGENTFPLSLLLLADFVSQ